MQNAHTCRHRSAIFRVEPQLEMPHRFAADRDLGDGTALRAVPVSVGVGSVQNIGAGGTDDLFGGVAENPLGASVPEDDAVVPIRGENRIGRVSQRGEERLCLFRDPDAPTHAFRPFPRTDRGSAGHSGAKG
jgi:hypothetical protein